MAKVGTSNQDRTISLKAAVRSCINKQTYCIQRICPRNRSSTLFLIFCVSFRFCHRFYIYLASNFVSSVYFRATCGLIRHNRCHELCEYLLSGLLIVLNRGEWSDSRAGGPTTGEKNTLYLLDRRMASPRTVLSTGWPRELKMSSLQESKNLRNTGRIKHNFNVTLV